MKRFLAFPLVVAAFLVVPQARAQTPAEAIGTPFAALAGSAENAIKLARGLHRGNIVALRGTDANGNPSLVAFGIPRQGMSWEEVYRTLQRTQETFERNGIREATPRNIQAALLGGRLLREDGSAVAVDGVLASRAPQAFTEPGSGSSTGNPIYGDVPALPDVSPSTWGSYRPATRKSRQIEHVAGVVNAGYLR